MRRTGKCHSTRCLISFDVISVSLTKLLWGQLYGFTSQHSSTSLPTCSRYKLVEEILDFLKVLHTRWLGQRQDVKLQILFTPQTKQKHQRWPSWHNPSFDRTECRTDYCVGLENHIGSCSQDRCVLPLPFFSSETITLLRLAEKPWFPWFHTHQRAHARIQIINWTTYYFFNQTFLALVNVIEDNG